MDKTKFLKSTNNSNVFSFESNIILGNSTEWQRNQRTNEKSNQICIINLSLIIMEIIETHGRRITFKTGESM